MLYMEKYGYSKTLSISLSNMGQSNIIAVFSSLILCVFIIIREIDLASTPLTELNGLRFYKDYSSAYWFTANSLLFYAFAFPIYRAKSQPHGKKILKGFLFLFLFLFLVLIWFNFQRNVKGGETFFDFYTPLLPVFALISSLLILFIRLQVSSLARQTNHTIRAIFEMRMSSVYREHIDAVNKIYPLARDAIISPKEVRSYLNIDQEGEKVIQLCTDTKNAITSQIYILNHMEFLAVGINSYVLDEELLYTTLGGTVLGNFDRGSFLIENSLRKQPKAFEHLRRLINVWRLRHSYEENRCVKSMKFEHTDDITDRLNEWLKRSSINS